MATLVTYIIILRMTRKQLIFVAEIRQNKKTVKSYGL